MPRWLWPPSLLAASRARLCALFTRLTFDGNCQNTRFINVIWCYKQNTKRTCAPPHQSMESSDQPFSEPAPSIKHWYKSHVEFYLEGGKGKLGPFKCMLIRTCSTDAMSLDVVAPRTRRIEKGWVANLLAWPKRNQYRNISSAGWPGNLFNNIYTQPRIPEHSGGPRNISLFPGHCFTT